MAVVPTTGGQGQTPFSGSQRRNIAPVPAPTTGGLRFPPSPQPGGVPGVAGGGGGAGAGLTAGLNAIADRKARREALQTQIDQRDKELAQSKREAKASRDAQLFTNLDRMNAANHQSTLAMTDQLMARAADQGYTEEEIELYAFQKETLDLNNARRAGQMKIDWTDLERSVVGLPPLPEDEKDRIRIDTIADLTRGRHDPVFDPETKKLSWRGVNGGTTVRATMGIFYRTLQSLQHAGVDVKNAKALADKSLESLSNSYERIERKIGDMVNVSPGATTSGDWAAGLAENAAITLRVLPKINRTMSNRQILQIAADEYVAAGKPYNYPGMALRILDSFKEPDANGMSLPEDTEAFTVAYSQAIGQYFRIMEEGVPTALTIQVGGEGGEGSILHDIALEDIQTTVTAAMTPDQRSKLRLIKSAVGVALDEILGSTNVETFLAKNQIQPFLSEVSRISDIPGPPTGKELDAVLSQIAAEFLDDPRTPELEEGLALAAQYLSGALQRAEEPPHTQAPSFVGPPAPGGIQP